MPDTSPEGRFTIDELAHAEATKVSTIRMYQNRGLLPAPELEGRVGYYDDTHVARLRMIRRLQDDGFSLAGIKRLVDTWGAGGGLRTVLGEETPTPMRMHRDEFEQLFPGGDDPSAIECLVEMGALHIDRDEMVLTDDRLLRVATAMAGSGVPPPAIVDLANQITAHTDAIAGAFVELFEDHVWQAFVDRGLPSEELPALLAQLQQLRPLGVEVVAASMGNSIDRAAEGAIARNAGDLG